MNNNHLLGVDMPTGDYRIGRLMVVTLVISMVIAFIMAQCMLEEWRGDEDDDDDQVNSSNDQEKYSKS